MGIKPGPLLLAQFTNRSEGTLRLRECIQEMLRLKLRPRPILRRSACKLLGLWPYLFRICSTWSEIEIPHRINETSDLTDNVLHSIRLHLFWVITEFLLWRTISHCSCQSIKLDPMVLLSVSIGEWQSGCMLVRCISMM